MIGFIIASVVVVFSNIFLDIYTFRVDLVGPYGIANQVVIVI